jgi:hypothetical protein
MRQNVPGLVKVGVPAHELTKVASKEAPIGNPIEDKGNRRDAASCRRSLAINSSTPDR